MKQLAKVLLLIGLVLALLFGCLRANGSTAWPIPWLLVGGLGIACGIFDFLPREAPVALLSLIGLVVALSAILLQDFNPGWLNAIVFYVRVFFAHFLLSFAFLQLLWPGRRSSQLSD
jgi:ABC-type thiamin/hydroxymethylpyrimidine transport system permease subunit